MRILLLNQNWFAPEFREAGHEVISAGYNPGLDLALEIPLLHIDTVISALPNGFSPDLIIWHDNSSPIMFTGLEECDTPLIFYSVDSHHHYDLHAHIAHIFDQTYVAQSDYIEIFRSANVAAEWLPLWASRFVEASSEKSFGAAFVGNMNSTLNPDRVEFFEKLKALIPIHIKVGDYWTIFPHAEIVVNQTVKSDLNFRVFEAMMCGALLLTEHSSNGLLDLFKDGEHLVTYQKGNAEDAAQKIAYLLANVDRCREIAHAGREEILRAHLPRHRAEKILARAKGLTRTKNSQRFLAAMVNHSMLSILLEKKETGLDGKALVACLRSAEQALSAGEQIAETHCFYLITACFRYDNRLGSTAGTDLLTKFAEAFPENIALLLSRIRILLNSGKIAAAREIAANFAGEQAEVVFTQAEALVTEYLKMTTNYRTDLYPARQTTSP